MVRYCWGLVPHAARWLKVAPNRWSHAPRYVSRILHIMSTKSCNRLFYRENFAKDWFNAQSPHAHPPPHLHTCTHTHKHKKVSSWKPTNPHCSTQPMHLTTPEYDNGLPQRDVLICSREEGGEGDGEKMYTIIKASPHECYVSVQQS